MTNCCLILDKPAALWWPLEDFRNKFLLWVFSNGDPRELPAEAAGEAVAIEPHTCMTTASSFQAAGNWKLRFNSDWQGYSKDFEGHWSGDVVAEPGEYDGFTSVRTAC